MHTGIVSLLKITILIFHADAVPPAELQRAETLAAAIFRQAGIETTWRTATGDDLAPRPTEISLHLLPVHPAILTRETSGYAVLLGNASYAGVSCPAVRASAATLEAEASTVMGAVIAHELGHILLRTRDHATSGVMVTRLGTREIQEAQRGELQFLHSEAQRIRAEVRRRAPPTVHEPMPFHLAQLNLARMIHPLTDPRLKEFVDALDPINALADQSPGFVWRLKSESGNATDVSHPWSTDPFLLVNMSVWESPDDLRNYTYRSGHMEIYQRRAEWFEKPSQPHYVLWWIPRGHIPKLEEARERLKHYRANGATPHAFWFGKLFPAPVTAAVRAPQGA